MTTTEAAVLRGPRELDIERLHLDPPKDEEVRVKLRATGICGSDYRRYAGKVEAPYPIVLGHEGAGVVEAVGDDVTSVEPGDRVVLAFDGSCGSCHHCTVGDPSDCNRGLEIAFGGMLLDGTRRLHAEDGTGINHFFAQSSFARHAIVPDRTVVPVGNDVPLDRAALLGCGARTGIGAVLNTAGVRPGDDIAIFGCGGLGMSALVAAAAASASEIIAVDIFDSKLEAAKRLGATATVNATHEDPREVVERRTGRGVDFAFEFVGNTDTMAQAFDATRQGGETIVAGATHPEATVEIPATDLLKNKKLQGTLGGDTRPHRDIPRYIDLYRQGDLDLDALLTKTYPLADIEEAFDAFEDGDVIRTAITFE